MAWRRKSQDDSNPIHQLESLESRVFLSVSATFDAPNGVLSVFGDQADNVIEISRTVGGEILINNGEVSITGGTPTVANTALVEAFGFEGADQISVNQLNGALPAVQFDGGAGNDLLIGGSGHDVLIGGSGDDELLGKGGFDILFGGADNDTLIGGDADDVVFGDAGNDLMIWNPGDDTDVNEGGDGIDTVQVNGGGGAEQFTTTANGTRVRFDRIDPAPFSLDIGTSESLVVVMNGGDDSHSATGNLAALIQITVDGGDGNDTILGSNGVDLLIGGDGNDFVDGQQGNDVVFLGIGDDVFQWDPGDGSDVVEGQDGADTMLFNGSNGSEIFDASANGERVRFTRNLGNIVMDLDGVEAIDLKAFGGADTVTINDLSGTDLGAIDIDLAAPGGVGDAQIDAVIVNATDSDDVIGFSGDSSTTKVLGPGAEVTVGGAELANDSLIVNGLAGNDAFDPSALTGTAIRIVADGGDGNDVVLVNGLDSDEQFTATANGTLVRVNRISPTPFFVDAAAESLVVVMNGGNDTFSATGNLAALIQITVDGGDGNDTILGSNGVDLLIGGDGNDFVDGQQGNDVAFLGAGDDVFQWDPGDGSDVVEGQDGADTLVFNGSNTGEIFDVSANGERVRFTRNLGNIVMDLNGVEAIDLNTFGGSDVVTVNDATGTDLVKVDVDLAAFGGVGDAQIDSVVVNAGGGSDVVEILGAGTSVSIAGLSTHVTLSGAEAANDQLVLNTQAGDDAVDASALPAGVVILSLNGGDGHDDLTGSAGADTIVGGRGNDVVMGQEGSDVINWSTGDGSDVIDGGEGFDFVQINGSEIADRMDVASDAGRVIVRRTSSALTDATNNGALDIGTVESIGISLLGGDDRVTFGSLIGVTDLTGLSVFAGAGNDFIGASDLTLGLFADAGDGRDTIYGGLSHDTLLGGDGRDCIDGGEGNDLILGGADKDIIKGGDGNDLLGGDEGDDLIYGGLGDDSLDGGDGFDVLDGGDGTDNGVNGEVLINFP